MAMNQWLPGDRAKHKIWRKLLLVTIILAFCLAIAMAWCARLPCQVSVYEHLCTFTKLQNVGVLYTRPYILSPAGSLGTQVTGLCCISTCRT